MMSLEIQHASSDAFLKKVECDFAVEEEPSWLIEAADMLEHIKAAETAVAIAAAEVRHAPISAATTNQISLPGSTIVAVTSRSSSSASHAKPKPRLNLEAIENMAKEQVSMMTQKPVLELKVPSPTSTSAMALSMNQMRHGTPDERRPQQATTSAPRSPITLSAADLATFDPLVQPLATAPKPMSPKSWSAIAANAHVPPSAVESLPASLTASLATAPALLAPTVKVAITSPTSVDAISPQPELRRTPVSLSPSPNEDAVRQSLMLMFPNADGSTIEDVLHSTGSAEEAVSTLLAMHSGTEDLSESGEVDESAGSTYRIRSSTQQWQADSYVHANPSTNMHKKRLTGEKPSWTQAGQRFTGSMTHAVEVARAKVAKRAVRRYGMVI